MTQKAVSIGGYAAGGDAYIRFRGRVIDRTLINGKNDLYVWTQIGYNNVTIQNRAHVIVVKQFNEVVDTICISEDEDGKYGNSKFSESIIARYSDTPYYYDERII